MIRRVILIFMISLCGVLDLELTAQSVQQDSLVRYDENIFIISNYSGVAATLPEESTVAQLLENHIGGFRFYLEPDAGNSQLLVRNPDKSFTSLKNVLDIIRQSLETDSSRILTLFLDFTFNAGELENAFLASGLYKYLYVHDIEGNWPAIATMVNTGQRIVVFSMQTHINSPSWLHYIWHFAIRPLSLSTDEVSYTSGSFDGDPQKHLMVFNGLNAPSVIEMQDELNNQASQNPYFIELLKSVWMSNGKTPNFIMMDCFNSSIASSLDRIRGFHTIKGTVAFDDEILDYVNWQGMKSLTTGSFSFVIAPHEELTLAPQSPGFKFTPSTISVDESFDEGNLHFKGIPLKITEDLEACYSFDNHVRDASRRKNNGKGINIVYINDMDRNWVASLKESSLVRLERAETLKMQDHDFTVAVWVKIREYLNEASDQCILSSATASYQSGLHFVIRNRRPYLGFFNDDLAGNSTIEEGQWYHIVWRYNKLSNEQAIYVNGKLDAISLRRPSYKGSDTIYVGAIYSPELTMRGEIDDLCLWSRALGDEEILSLSGQKYHIESHLGFFRIRSFYLYLPGIVIIIFFLYRAISKRRKGKSPQPLSGDDVLPSNTRQDRLHQNSIKLFGDFKVTDKNGNDITAHFSPKLKQLFLLLLIHSQRNTHGISTKDLSDILWKGQSIKDTKSLRGVTIRNLRLVLENLDKTEITFQHDSWSIKLSDNLYCDYFECLKYLDSNQLHKKESFTDFYHIIRSGELFMGESYHWLDDTKGFTGNRIVDIILNYLEANKDMADNDLFIGLAEQVLIYDPVNDVALVYKMKALIRQNNHHLARFTFERFCALYKEMYGEPFNRSFNELTA